MHTLCLGNRTYLYRTSASFTNSASNARDTPYPNHFIPLFFFFLLLLIQNLLFYAKQKKFFYKEKGKRKIVSLSIHIIPPIIHNGWIERRTHFFLFLLNHFFSPLPPQTKQSRAVITTPPHPNFSLQPPSHLSPPTHSAGLSNPNSIDPAAYHLRPTPAPGPGPGPRLNKGQTSCFPLMQKFKKGEEEKNRESEKGKKKKPLFCSR